MLYNSAVKKGSLLRRYNRLLTRYNTHRHEVSLAQIADTLACTSRYARSLLHEMQEEGWLVWNSRPGRGALGVLQCRMNAAALETLVAGEYPASETEMAAVQAQPHYSSDGFRYFISFYRPLLAPIPSIHTDRAGRHILQMVHAGLARHIPEQVAPIPGLAHTITCSEDGLRWRFILRRGLVWHNGEPVLPEQLRQTLERYAGGPGLPHVMDVKCENYVLTMQLGQRDNMLLYRLANPVYALPHPRNGSIGLGPFKVSEHSSSQLVLTRAASWYGETPQASEIVYNTPLSVAPLPALVRLDTPHSMIAPEAMTERDNADAFYYVTFNQARGRLNAQQQAFIRRVTRCICAGLIEREETLGPLPEWLQPTHEPDVQALLPDSLNLVYFRSTEMRKVVDELAKSLRYRGCKVTLTPISVTHWLLQDKNWAEQDLCMGFLRFEQHDAFSMEERYRHSVMWAWFWGEAVWRRGISILDRINAGPAERYSQRVKRLMRFLSNRRWIVPLLAQRYRLVTPASVQGVFCYPQSWPDFTRLWTDESQPTESIQPQQE